MDKGFDVLYDCTYDFDINWIKSPEDYELAEQNDESLAILSSRFICKKIKEERKLFARFFPKFDAERNSAVLKSYKLLKKNQNQIENLKHKNVINETIHQNLVRKAEIRAFEFIKERLLDLIKKGSLRALAKYLTWEQVEFWRHDLINYARKIEEKKTKTPEEWEVVAALHSADFIKELNCDIKTASIESQKAFITFEKVFLNNEPNDSELSNFLKLKQSLMETEYVHALQKAQFGYYSRYNSTLMVYDMSSYFELTHGLSRNVLDCEALKEQFGQKFYNHKYLANITEKNFPKLEKYAVLRDAFAFANILFLEKGSKHALKIINNISKELLKDEIIELQNMGKKESMPIEKKPNKSKDLCV